MPEISPQILAAFTQARRQHEGLTRGQLARALSICADQVAKAEAARPCGEEATVRLKEWNGLHLPLTGVALRGRGAGEPDGSSPSGCPTKQERGTP